MAYNNNYYAPYYAPYNGGAVPETFNQMKGQYQQPMQNFQQPIQQPQNVQQPTPQQYPQTTNNTPTNDIIWVQGEAGAKAYLVAPNNTVTLWDSESSTIYIKSADSSGIPSMRILDFTERSTNAPQTPVEHVCKCGDKFVTKEQFDGLQAKISELEGIVNSLKEKNTTKASTKSVKTTKGE